MIDIILLLLIIDFVMAQSTTRTVQCSHSNERSDFKYRRDHAHTIPLLRLANPFGLGKFQTVGFCLQNVLFSKCECYNNTQYLGLLFSVTHL